jgi:two-component sensor histidine kinase
MSVQDAEDARATVEGPHILLPPARAVALGMVLHELFTNALKYGALSNKDGRVGVRWTSTPALIELSWREDGGPPVTIPQRRGFGSVLIERMVKGELEGAVDLDFRPQGIVCMIKARLPDGAPPRGRSAEGHTVQAFPAA